jgi:hypothetical protein
MDLIRRELKAIHRSKTAFHGVSTVLKGDSPSKMVHLSPLNLCLRNNPVTLYRNQKGIRTMLKCITFDGDASTLNTLMGYFEKLDRALAEVHEVLDKDQFERPIFVREGSKIIRLRCEDILFLEGYGDYVKIHRVNGKPLLSQVSLKRFEENLDEKSFCRVHRSYIVALSHINYIERKRIRIENELIPISDSYLPQLMGKLSLQE